MLQKTALNVVCNTFWARFRNIRCSVTKELTDLLPTKYTLDSSSACISAPHVKVIVRGIWPGSAAMGLFAFLSRKSSNRSLNTQTQRNAPPSRQSSTFSFSTYIYFPLQTWIASDNRLRKESPRYFTIGTRASSRVRRADLAPIPLHSVYRRGVDTTKAKRRA